MKVIVINLKTTVMRQELYKNLPTVIAGNKDTFYISIPTGDDSWDAVISKRDINIISNSDTKSVVITSDGMLYTFFFETLENAYSFYNDVMYIKDNEKLESGKKLLRHVNEAYVIPTIALALICLACVIICSFQMQILPAILFFLALVFAIVGTIRGLFAMRNIDALYTVPFIIFFGVFCLIAPYVQVAENDLEVKVADVFGQEETTYDLSAITASYAEYNNDTDEYEVKLLDNPSGVPAIIDDQFESDVRPGMEATLYMESYRFFSKRIIKRIEILGLKEVE